MDEHSHSRRQRTRVKRQKAMESATALIRAICEGRVDAYEGWQQVCGIFQNNAGLGLPELKVFVRIEGIDPNSSLSVTEELRNTIMRKAAQFLADG
jgi:hypothetical protein